MFFLLLVHMGSMGNFIFIYTLEVEQLAPEKKMGLEDYLSFWAGLFSGVTCC